MLGTILAQVTDLILDQFSVSSFVFVVRTAAMEVDAVTTAAELGNLGGGTAASSAVPPDGAWRGGADHWDWTWQVLSSARSTMPSTSARKIVGGATAVLCSCHRARHAKRTTWRCTMSDSSRGAGVAPSF